MEVEVCARIQKTRLVWRTISDPGGLALFWGPVGSTRAGSTVGAGAPVVKVASPEPGATGDRI